MFTNLIESSAHGAEFKRRTSFFLATVATYALFLFAAGIVGVITYDAQVEAQTTEMLADIWIPPVNRAPDRPRRAPRPASNNNRISPRPTRPILYESVNNPIKPPETVSANPNPIPPAPPGAGVAPYVSDPPTTPGNSPCETCTGNDTSATPVVVENRTPPPAVDPPKPTTLRVSPAIIIAKVVDLPKPNYPALAKQAGIQGPVNVQILIDETGKVISAQAVKGSAMLTQAAVNAARRARFTPTMLGDQPVKVQGVITYNFVLQQ